ncbi:MAG: hypothetical protein ACM3VT_00395 [Solirubrobacterales bacterium]
MISTARGGHRGLRLSRLEEVRPSWLQEILQSIRWMHQEHVKDLRGLGYSPKEAFWLDFACLPFLPWDKAAGPELRLSMILGLYADIHRSTLGSLEPVNAQAFLSLLKQRYRTIRQKVAESGGPAAESTRPQTPAESKPPTGDSKEALAGLIVMRTAREWGQHRSAFPCRLVEDI